EMRAFYSWFQTGGYVRPSVLPWLVETRGAGLEMHNLLDKSADLSPDHIYHWHRRHAAIHAPKQFYFVQTVFEKQTNSLNQSGLFARQWSVLIAGSVPGHNNLKIKSDWLKDLNPVAVSRHKSGILNSIKPYQVLRPAQEP